MEEIWKDIKNYEGLYQVSNLGRIKSIDRYVLYNRHHLGTMQLRKSKIISPVKMINNYLRVQLSKEGKHKLHLIHRLVAEVFIPNPNNYKEINHIDCDKTNNCVNNLEWTTSKYNKEHAYKNNLYKNEKPIFQIKNGIIIKEYKSATECERQTGYCATNIGKVALGKRKTAYGYQWQYKNKK